MDQKTIDKLEADFDEKRVKVKQVGDRPPADYLEAYDVINTANEVFGYGNWGTEIVDFEIIPSGNKYVVRAAITLAVEGSLPRQDVGVNISAGGSPEALETAIKGAVSDALKRAMRHFGRQFGNDLYDKDRNGQAPPPRGTEKSKGNAEKPTGGKVSGDPMSTLWAYANARGLKEGAVTEALAQNDNNPEKALVCLKELE